MVFPLRYVRVVSWLNSKRTWRLTEAVLPSQRRIVWRWTRCEPSGAEAKLVLPVRPELEDVRAFLTEDGSAPSAFPDFKNRWALSMEENLSSSWRLRFWTSFWYFSMMEFCALNAAWIYLSAACPEEMAFCASKRLCTTAPGMNICHPPPRKP